MKTTIEIADDLFERAQRIARKEKTNFRSLAEQGLRIVLKEKQAAPPPTQMEADHTRRWFCDRRCFQDELGTYLDSTIWYLGDAELPASFTGVSGGPVWGMELKHHKCDGHISIEKHALIGITFYQMFGKR